MVAYNNFQGSEGATSMGRAQWPLEQATQSCSWPKGMGHGIFLTGLLGGSASLGSAGFGVALPGSLQSSLRCGCGGARVLSLREQRFLDGSCGEWEDPAQTLNVKKLASAT